MLNVHLLTNEDYASITKKIEDLEEKVSLLMESKEQTKKSGYLTVKEFIDEIKVSRGTFENMKNESNPTKFKVQFKKLNNKILVPQTEVERYYDFY